MTAEFDSYIAALNQRLGNKSARSASAKAPRGEVTDVVPSGIDALDKYVIGSGGFPCRRMTEIYADEGSGKSSLLYALFANAQKHDMITHLFETENRLDRTRLETFGIDLDRLGLSEPPYLEQLLADIEAALDALPRKTPALFGWDSFAATPSEAEVKEGLTGKAAVADRARVMSRAIRVMSEKVAKHNCAFVVINQVRVNIGQMFGEKESPPGGKAMRFFASVRLSLMGGQALKKGPYHIGKAPVCTCVKNMFAPPWRKARLYLVYNEGWSNERSLLELGREMGIVPEDARLSSDNIARIEEVLDLAEWDPLRIEETSAKLDEVSKAKATKKTEPASSEEPKKTGKKKASKKK